MPPIETPTTCASRYPSASNRPTVSRAMSPRWYWRLSLPPRRIANGLGLGKLVWVDRPTSRLSNRIARYPRSARLAAISSGQAVLLLSQPGDQHDRWCRLVTERVVAQLDSAADVDDRFVRHADTSAAAAGTELSVRGARRVQDRPSAMAGCGGDTARMRGLVARVGGAELELPQQGSQCHRHLHVGERSADATVGMPPPNGIQACVSGGFPTKRSGLNDPASAKLSSEACASEMLTRITYRSGMTHSPNLIRVLVRRAVPLITGRVRCTSNMVACSRSESPVSASSVSRVKQPRVPPNPLDSPRQCGRGGLVSRRQQGEQLVGHVIVGNRRPVFVPRLQHHGQYVVAVGECRVPRASAISRA